MVIGVSDYFRVLQLHLNGKVELSEHASIVNVHPKIFLFCIFGYVVNQVILLEVSVLVCLLFASVDNQLH